MKKAILFCLLATTFIFSLASEAGFRFHIGPGAGVNEGYYPNNYAMSRGYSPFYTYSSGYRYTNPSPADGTGTVPEADINYNYNKRHKFYADQKRYLPYKQYPNKCINC
jgi:hypothetical protein